MCWKIDEILYSQISALINNYRTYHDSNTERFVALSSEAAKLRIRVSSVCLFKGYRHEVNLSPPLRGPRV